MPIEPGSCCSSWISGHVVRFNRSVPKCLNYKSQCARKILLSAAKRKIHSAGYNAIHQRANEFAPAEDGTAAAADGGRQGVKSFQALQRKGYVSLKRSLHTLMSGPTVWSYSPTFIGWGRAESDVAAD